MLVETGARVARTQISTRVCRARLAADSFLPTHAASRSSGVPASVTVRTSLARAACTAYWSSLSAPRAIVFHQSIGKPLRTKESRRSSELAR